jgi:preprotein translocase subunit YajC
MNWFLAADAPGGGMMPALITLLPWLFFIIVFYYFFVAAPMKKKQKAFQEMMSSLKSGDRVLTNSGMYGVVTGITDRTVKLRIANNVVVDMDKSAISGLATEETKEEKK